MVRKVSSQVVFNLNLLQLLEYMKMVRLSVMK
nr:MAG TPA: hypothetical protein [Bacteriophage sp.]